MSDTALQSPAPRAVRAEIPYTADTGETLVNETFGPNNIRRRSSGTLEWHAVDVQDGRPLAGTLSLDRNGFLLVRHETAVRDFFDPHEIESVYYPEVAALIREPVLWAHNDYTEWSAPQRVRDLLPDEADALLARRFAIIQVWRAINRPIQSNPLAIADAGSVAFDDLLVAERRYPGRIGQTYRLRYNPAHRWFYFPEMRRDEALVFKVFDSLNDGRARFTAHTSFDDPQTPRGAPPRQSIEARALVFF
jgi:hypothetical protein